MNYEFGDIYKDFFTKDYNLDNNTDSKMSDEKELIDIDSLFISDDSKELLKKIISYMEKYDLKEETNYITFNIKINGTDKLTTDAIVSLLGYYSKKYNYVKNNDISEFSLYKIDNLDDINTIYKNGLVHITDLDAINMKDSNFKRKFFYLLMRELSSKSITFISGKDEVLREFLLNDDKLSSEYFLFNIDEVKASVSDVYNEIVSKVNMGEDFNIKLLDYITNTFPKSLKDYTTYTDYLYKYISFNKSLPDIVTVRSVDDVFKEMNELVGLSKVKNSLYDLVDLITLKNKTKDDLKIQNINLHMVFLGNPGTGKTTVARMIGDILYNLGYIKSNKLIEVSSKDLVAEYVGQTAVKTMNVINKAMGGILFIDEAYTLATTNNDNSFNGECIATLIKAMEDYRDNLVVIFAGYTKEMQAFLNSNSGIASRIGYTLEFDDYTNEELKEIFSNMVKKSGFKLDSDALEKVDELINENRDMRNFGNARFIRNVYEKTIINHAKNTNKATRKSVLKTITKEDITY